MSLDSALKDIHAEVQKKLNDLANLKKEYPDLEGALGSAFALGLEIGGLWEDKRNIAQRVHSAESAAGKRIKTNKKLMPRRKEC